MASWNTPRVWTAAITLALLPLLPALLVKHYQQDAKFQITAARLRLEDGRFLAFGTRGTKTNKHKVFYFHGTPASRLEFMSLSGVLADCRGASRLLPSSVMHAPPAHIPCPTKCAHAASIFGPVPVQLSWEAQLPELSCCVAAGPGATMPDPDPHCLLKNEVFAESVLTEPGGCYAALLARYIFAAF